MRTRLVGAGQVAILALLVFMVIWYRDFLAEKFEPVKNQLLSSKCEYNTTVGIVALSN